MASEAERAAFAKACAYLNYSPVARWLAVACGVGMAVLYVALLFLLWLFADLMVHRGAVPELDELAPQDAQHLATLWSAIPQDDPTEPNREALLEAVGADEALAAVDPLAPTTSAHDRHLIWRAYVPYLLDKQVGPGAAQLVRRRFDQPLDDVGMLSLVVRSQMAGRFYAPITSLLARWNPWTWHPRTDAFPTASST